MRDYAQLMPAFYVKGSGRQLRGDAVALAVAPYLFAAPLSNMIGLYHLRVSQVADDLGFDERQVSDAIDRIEEAGLVRYDRDQGLVFLPEGARTQMNLRPGKPISPKDKRLSKVEKALDIVTGHPFEQAFRRRYLPHTLAPDNHTGKPLPCGLDGASSGAGSPFVPAPAPVPDPEGGSGGPAPAASPRPPAPPPLDPPPEGTDPWVVDLAAAIAKTPALHRRIRAPHRVAQLVYDRAVRLGGGIEPRQPFGWYVAAAERFALDVLDTADAAGEPLPDSELVKRFVRWVSQPKDPGLWHQDDGAKSEADHVERKKAEAQHYRDKVKRWQAEAAPPPADLKAIIGGRAAS